MHHRETHLRTVQDLLRENVSPDNLSLALRTIAAQDLLISNETLDRAADNCLMRLSGVESSTEEGCRPVIEASLSAFASTGNKDGINTCARLAVKLLGHEEGLKIWDAHGLDYDQDYLRQRLERSLRGAALSQKHRQRLLRQALEIAKVLGDPADIQKVIARARWCEETAIIEEALNAI